MKNTSTRFFIKNTVFFIFGITITAIAVSLFSLPNKIVAGGSSGIATLLYFILGLPPGGTNFAINITLLLFCAKTLGKTFALSTLTGSFMLSLLVQLFSYLPPFTENLLLASVFGGILFGLGVGLCFVSGGSTGGTDILGRLLQKKFKHLPIGTLLMIVDGIIILVSYLFFKNNELTLYGIITLAVSTFTIDTIIRKLNVSKLAFVITAKGKEMSKELVKNFTRGCTVINSFGAYTFESNYMLVCALKESELPTFREKILQYDSGAFIIFSNATQIVGNGFHVYM